MSATTAQVGAAGVVGSEEDGPAVSSYLFAADSGAPLVRRAADVLRFAVALGVFLLLGWAASNEVPFDTRVLDFFEATPSWLRTLAWMAYTGSAIAALGLFGAAMLRGGVQRGVLRDIVVTILIGTAVALIAARWATGSWPNFLPEFFDSVDGPAYPSVRTTLVVAVISVMAPYFTYPVRRLGWWVVAAAVVAPIVLGLATISSSVGAVALASVSVAAVRLVFGSPEGLPPIGRLAATLERIGVPTDGLAYLDDQPGTVGLARTTAADGRTLSIKVYGKDAADRQRSERLWRSLWYRSSGPAPGASRVQQVEHEALALLVADRAEVNVSEVVEAGQDESGDVVLVVVEPDGTPMDEADPATIDDGVLDALWRQLGAMRSVKLAHGRLAGDTILMSADGPAFVDFSNSSVLPTPHQYGGDVAALLASTAIHVGPARAVAAALRETPRNVLIAALPFLQTAVVDPALRTSMKRAKLKFDDLRSPLVEQLDVDEPALADVKRVSVSDVVMVVFAIIAVNALISQIAQVGFDTVVDELRNASIAWLIVAFLIKISGYSTAYIGVNAAVTQPVPFMPTCVLQSANSFVGLVVPSTVGKVAMDVRYLQKLGVPTTTAVAQGPVISFLGFVVEIALLLLTSWALGQAVETDSLGDQDSGGLLGIVAVVVIVGLIVIAAVPKLRAKVLPKIKEAYHAVKEVVTSPSRLGRIVLSEFLERIVGALALAATAAAFGVSVPFTALIFVSVGTGLLAGIAPVPGGVGVAEATMTALLTAVGVPAEQAFSIAIIYRIVTSYLPPVIGFYSLRWMEDKGYL